MTPLSIVFVVLYLIALCFYFYTRPSGNIKLRAINKYIMATLYLVYAIIQFALNYEATSFTMVLMAALVLAYLGDIFLVFQFGRGGDFFLSGNICFVVYYIALFAHHGFSFGDYFWVLIPWAVLLGAFILLSKKFPNVIKLDKMRLPMTFYLSSIILHGMFGLGCIVLLPSLPMVLCGVGSVMFMISDMILTVDRFIVQNNKWIVRANSLFYFGGLMLIVLSLGY